MAFYYIRDKLVRVCGGWSSLAPVVGGVPQLLLLILMTNITTNLTLSVVTFAEDTQLYLGIKRAANQNVLQDDFNIPKLTAKI